MTLKKDLGQFFTTNVGYILQGFEPFLQDKDVMDPFAGGGDLLAWAAKHGAASVSGLDIDQRFVKGNIGFNDSLKNIPYAPFSLTNPPYLGKNKMTPDQKEVYPMDEYEDMYLLSIKKLIESGTEEGIIIIPVNFFSAENSDKLRKEFLTQYSISKVNYFREQVFVDTTYNVVSFHYIKKTIPSTEQEIKFTFFPDKTDKSYVLEEQFSYRIAGRDLHKILKVKPLKIIRLTEDLITKNDGNEEIYAMYNDKNEDNDVVYDVAPFFAKIIKNNIILLNCIDTNASEDGWIRAEDVRDLYSQCLVGKSTSRNIAYVMLDGVSISDQEKIIDLFNQKLNALRRKYNSLFLTNFRDNDRKRVSFDFCYKLISYCFYEIHTFHNVEIHSLTMNA